MSDSPAENRYAPTQTRLQEAFREGNFARSNQLASLIFCLGSIAVMLMFGGSIVQQLRDMTTANFANSPNISGSDLAAGSSLSFWKTTTAIAPLLLMFAGVAWFSHAWQSKFRIFPNRLSLDFERLHPANNLKRIFSTKTIWNAFIGLLRMICVLGFGLSVIWTMRGKIGMAGVMPNVALINSIVEIAMWILGGGIALMLLFGIIDWLWQVKSHETSLRMNDQQMRDEMKSTEGNPQIKARQKAIRRSNS